MNINTPETFSAIGKGMPLPPHHESTLLQRDGSGCITNMFFAGDFPGVEDTIIRVYVDGSNMPAIAGSLYLLHGIGFHDHSGPWYAGSKLGKIGKQNGLHNSYQIPFSNGIRITAERVGGVDNPLFWWSIRGIKSIPTRIGMISIPDTARLHLCVRDNVVVEPMHEFDLCNFKGSGSVYQVTICAKGNDPVPEVEWHRLCYMESCIRAYIGGNDKPLFVSSGLEDYFLGTYYFNTGKYATPLAGLTHFDQDNRSFSAYRFHDDDPIYFTNGLRMTCRNGDTTHGRETEAVIGSPTATTYTTYCWAYLW